MDLESELCDLSERLQTLSKRFSNSATNDEAQKYVNKIGKLVLDLEQIPIIPCMEAFTKSGMLPESDEDEDDFIAEDDRVTDNHRVSDTASEKDSSPLISRTVKREAPKIEDELDDTRDGIDLKSDDGFDDLTENEISNIIEDEFDDEFDDELGGESNEEVCNEFDDEFEDDFDDKVLQQLDEAEKNYVNDLTTQTSDEEDAINQPTESKYQDRLKKYFGFGKFRPCQWKIIHSVLVEKRDVLAIMATGYGKSLTYQFPSVFTGRTSIIVSPLISLMEDQVSALSTVNVKACYLGTAQRNTAAVLRDVLKGEYRLVYVTPEYVEGNHDMLREMDQKIGIDLIAIDEAHCVSQWGHDFRSAYRHLGSIRKILPNVPLIAVTATATPEVRTDIIRSLHLKNPTVTCTSFDRPNLYLSVSVKSGDIVADLQRQMVKIDSRLDRYKFDAPTIIYCPTKKGAENVHSTLKVLGAKSALYHAGLSLDARKQAHRDFINDDVEVVVATVAFGMGIDKPDVRKIIHYGAPKDIESYYQEIGRAGRDGEKSTCHVYYSIKDFATNKFFLKDIKSEKFRAHKNDMLSKMTSYLSSAACRRRMILAHFENKDVKNIGETEYCCDNCTNRLRRQQVNDHAAPSDVDMERNFGKEAQDMFQAIQALGSKFGLAVPILFLAGSVAQRLPQYFHNHKLHGSGKYRNATWWKSFGRQLMNSGYLEEKSKQGTMVTTVELSRKASDWLNSQHKLTEPKLMMLPNLELLAEEAPKRVSAIVPKFERKVLPMVQMNTWQSTREVVSAKCSSQPAVNPKDAKLQTELYRRLITVRNAISHELDVQPNWIFSNKCLIDMAKHRPTTYEKLISLDEVAEERARRYGDRFLQEIQVFCDDSNWQTDVMPIQINTEVKLSRQHELTMATLTETTRQSYVIFEVEKKSLDQAAFHRGLSVTTIVTHLCNCITAGLPVDIERAGVTNKTLDLITETIRNPPINSDISRLTPIKEQLPSHIDFSQIKIVIAILQRRFGVQGDLLDSDATPVSVVTTQPVIQKQQSLPASATKASIQRFSSTGTHVSSSNVSKVMANTSQVASQSQSADSSVAASSQNDSGKRKLPAWMASSKQEKAKKIKKSGLFNR